MKANSQKQRCLVVRYDLLSDGIQNFKNRFSFVSYFLTTGSFIKV